MPGFAFLNSHSPPTRAATTANKAMVRAVQFGFVSSVDIVSSRQCGCQVVGAKWWVQSGGCKAHAPVAARCGGATHGSRSIVCRPSGSAGSWTRVAFDPFRTSDLIGTLVSAMRACGGLRPMFGKLFRSNKKGGPSAPFYRPYNNQTTDFLYNLLSRSIDCGRIMRRGRVRAASAAPAGSALERGARQHAARSLRVRCVGADHAVQRTLPRNLPVDPRSGDAGYLAARSSGNLPVHRNVHRRCRQVCSPVRRRYRAGQARKHGMGDEGRTHRRVRQPADARRRVGRYP